jgi:2-keto-4-pentenoate hydratase/2-oxohepta-3-ene-1,7-dioic acid hydratase in catechol pathway
MTIFCVGRNYAAHAREMGQLAPQEGDPVVFLKPDAALVVPPGPLTFPQGIGEVHHEAEIVVRAGRDGRPEALALGLDLTDRTRQAAAKRAGLPWAAAKGFRGSAAVGPFVPLAEAPPLDRLRFTLAVNGTVRQRGDSADMLYPVPIVWAYLERWFGVRAGDLVFTGTPEGVGALAAGDHVTLVLDGVPEAGASFDVAAPGDMPIAFG